MGARSQEFCPICEQLTLHEMDPDSVNHVVHLLATVFLCGCWLPIWIIMALGAPTRRMRCTVCGHALGDLTQDQIENLSAIRAQKSAERQQAITDAKEATAKAIGTTVGTGATLIGSGVFAVFSTIKNVLATSLYQIDEMIKSLAGDDAFMVWFCRILLTATMLFVMSMILYWGGRYFGFIHVSVRATSPTI